MTVISNSTKEDLLRYVKVDPQKVRVVHDCVSAAFKPTPKEFNATKPIILQVGTGPNKNLERVAEALQGIPCHLRVIGTLTGRQTTVLQRSGIEYSSASNISDEEVVREYCRCDMLVFASTYEGFGLRLWKPSNGRPVVTSNILSMPEIAGESACLVDPFDVASIRAGILRILKDSNYCEELVQRGFKNVQRFQPRAIAAQYVKLYRELLDQC